ncbi:MAG: ferritin [Spirochaetales bacterium]|nr:ferritin [Spirochaetales bacterium]
MIKENVRKAMNEQIKNELESSYIYLSMAAYFESISLNGMAHWMRTQAHEETIHAMKFFDHIIERGGKVELLDLKQLKTSWTSVEEVWKDTLEHEQFITSKINGLMKLVREENDYAAESMLTWFVKEQVEEESSAGTVLDQINLVQQSKQGLLMLDRELGQRAFPAGSAYDPAAYNAAE